MREAGGQGWGKRNILIFASVVVVALVLLLARSCGRDDNSGQIAKRAAEPATATKEAAKPEPVPVQEPVVLEPAPEEVIQKTGQTPAAKAVLPEVESVAEEPQAELQPDASPETETALETPPEPPVEPVPDPGIEDEIFWKQARKANDEEAYRNYLSRFPDGKHAREANEILRSGMYPAGKNIRGYEEFRNIMTGTLFVLVPAGEFWMGSPEGEGEPDEHPRHRVYLDSYYIGKYEVTIGQYEKFCEETGNSVPEKPWLTEERDHPIVYPTWEDAKAYCDWAGLRLPTEAEWEKAARGNTDTTYYWGNEPARDMANFLGTGGKDKFAITSPVGSFPPNGYGACDMAGNIWEWCADWYKPDYYEHDMEDSLIKNPKGPSRGEFKVIRGGSWNYEEENMRPAFRTRLEPKHWYDFNGFRAALDYMPE